MQINKIASILLIGFLSTPTWAFSTFVVKDIKIVGLSRVDEGAALNYIQISKGDKVDQERLQKALRDLHNSNNFDNIDASEDNGVLIFKVKERPTIASINYTGNKDVTKEQIDKSLKDSGIVVNEALDRTSLSNIEKGLQDFYYGVGKYNAKVEAKSVNLPGNMVDLNITFHEGGAAEIQQINIVGNTVFSNAELVGLLDSKDFVSWWDFFGKRTYQKQILNSDLEKIRNYYLDHGYSKFQVLSTQVAMTEDKKGLYVTINVDEGAQYKIKDVKLIGDLRGERKSMMALLPIHPGKTYSGKDVTDTEEIYRKYLGRFGYATPEVKTYPTFDDKNKEVTLNISINPGKRAYVRNINISGNHVTSDTVLRREMRQQEGTWLNSAQVETSRSRLNRLGFFETVDITTVPVAGNDSLVDLDVKVKEQPSGSFNAGVGYGTESGLSLQFGVQDSNFLGTGNSAGISVSTNDYSKDINISYRDPYWTRDGVSLGGNIYWNSFNANDAGLEDYLYDSYGIMSNIGFPINEFNRLSFGVGYRHNNISRVSAYEQARQFFNIYKDSNDELNFNNYEVSFGWNRSTLNKGVFPTAGNSQSFSTRVTVPGSDLNFFKTDLKASFYQPLNRTHSYVALARVKIGYGDGIGTYNGEKQVLPFWENYYAGGSSSLRGFKSNSVGPRAFYTYNGDELCYNIGCDPSDVSSIQVSSSSIGGNASTTVSFELITPTPFLDEAYANTLRTSFFMDMGNVWDTQFDYESYSYLPKDQFDQIKDYGDPTRIRVSAGVSLQWLSPMGPLAFSLAWPIKRYPGDKDEVFTFNIGQTF